MIARIWKAIATAENTLHYIDHFEHAVLDELQQTDGFVDAYLLRRTLDEAEGDQELIAFTLWESLEVIHNFAGEDITRAVVAPEAQAVLKRYDDTVTHYEIVRQAKR
jgi:heme-degrading monooxygenase HmoA